MSVLSRLPGGGIVLILCVLVGLVCLSPETLYGEGRRVDVIEVESSINPVVAKFIIEAVEEATPGEVTCIVIRLDTPGGLDSSMRDIIKAILSSPIPVIVYVAPSGARAASAGVFITIAGHIAAMAPGTNIGAAHPVAAGGEQMDETMMKKVENDAAAYIRSLAEKKGRNVEWSVSAVRESVSESAEKALELGVIDLVSSTLDELLKTVHGRKIKTVAGETELDTEGAALHMVEMGLRYRILNVLGSPDIAYILLTLGMLGLTFEIINPGVIFPGVFGGICLVLAFFAFQILPVNYAGVLLMIIGIVLFVVEVKVISYGLLTVGGLVSLALGSIMLFDSSEPYMSVSWSLISAAVLTLGAFIVFALSFAIKAQTRKPTTGKEGLVGERGKVHKDIDPEGSVYVHGEYWDAMSDEPIMKGENVEVVGVDNLTIKVRKISH